MEIYSKRFVDNTKKLAPLKNEDCILRIVSLTYKIPLITEFFKRNSKNFLIDLQNKFKSSKEYFPESGKVGKYVMISLKDYRRGEG